MDVRIPSHRKRTGAQPVWLLFAVFFISLLSGCGGGGEESAAPAPTPTTPNAPSSTEVTFTKTSPGCLACHEKIENIHPRVEIACTDCHGGDFTQTEKDLAHVMPTEPVIMDATTPPLDYDLPYQRFVNPSNLRVVEETCGNCHEQHVDNVKKSLMATSAGHHSGGLYQAGIDASKTPTYGNFEVSDEDGDVPTELGAVHELQDLIDYDPNADQSKFGTHYAAVPGQACVRCHLWTRGKGYRGAEGQDGLYRADGCAACHMTYSNDGLSQSADDMINHKEKGHPITHQITRNVPSEQCIHCHHRGSRIGLSFTGRSQMPPRLPSGPGIPGTTDVKFNTNYHYSDPNTNPIDIHGELDLHCVDCHTQNGIMGDGNVYGHMDQATKIDCRTCHGLPDTAPTLIDKDGLHLNNMVAHKDGSVTLTSKVTGKKHDVPLIKNIVDPNSPDYNPLAAAAMDENHIKEEGGLECYSCHSSWAPNCFGCHFERDETKMGLNLITREEVVGKASTNNKMFVALRHFAMGKNSSDKVSPFIVGCHPIADVTAEDGSKLLDYVMPETQNGKSGLAFNPVNPHTTRGRGEVRTCIECHRSPPSLGLGTGNYSLGRTYAYVLSEDGVQVFERWTNPAQPVASGTIPPLANNRPFAMDPQPNIVTGRADYLYVAYGSEGIGIYDMQGEALPTTPVAVISGIEASELIFRAGFLYVVNRTQGIQIYDVQDPTAPTLISSVTVPLARKIQLWGIDLFVASGADGLTVIDISNQQNPVVSGQLTGFNADDVLLYSHFQNDNQFAARAYIADSTFGIHVLDLLPDFNRPTLVNSFAISGGAHGLDNYTRYMVANGDTPSQEHDFLYVASGSSGLTIWDMTVPDAVVQVAAVNLGGIVVDVDVTSQPVPPGVDDYAYLTNTTAGLQVVDVTDPVLPVLVNTAAVKQATKVHVDVQQLDRYLDEQGNELKENSHPGAAPFNRADLVKILRADISIKTP